MIATRLRQLGMLLFSMLLCAVAFFQMFERTTNGFPQNYVWMLAFVSALFLTAWGLLLRFQPHADQSVMCCVLVLTGIGVTMIARLDQDTKTTVAFRQLLWLAIALVFANLLVVFMRDYRVLRRFSYVSMVIGIVLLLSPMLPVVGSDVSGGPGSVVCATTPSVVRWHAVVKLSATPRPTSAAAATRTCVFILATICG